MKFAITGATGFIGRKLTDKLRLSGHEVKSLGRTVTSSEPLEGVNVIIHLAGEPVAQRWSVDVKRRIRESRSKGTRDLVHALSTTSARPKTLISASAIGYYGTRGDEVLNEGSCPGSGFLPEVCVEWEKEARLAEALGMRVAMPRIGIVLGRDGGALKQMLPPFRLGAGGPLAGGQQWMSWIHVDDMVELLVWMATHENVSGPVNAVSPDPVRNEGFTKALAEAIHRPAVIPVPAFGLKLLYGEMASVILASQRVVPEAALQGGFVFRHTNLLGVLVELCRDGGVPG